MAMSRNIPAFASKLHVQAMQTVVPAKVTEPGLTRKLSVSGPIRPEIYQKHMHMVLYYNKAHEEEDGWMVAGWLKESLSLTLSEDPMFAGRLRRSPDNEGELAIAFNDSGVRLVNAEMETTLSEFLNSNERENEEAQLAFWSDVDERNPQFSALFYVQVTNFQGDGYSIGITWSLLLADPIRMTSFLHKWTHTQNKILTQNDIPKTPMFYFPNFINTRYSSSSPILCSAPCNTRYKTMLYKLTGIHTERLTSSDSCKALASICFDEAVRKLGRETCSTLSVIATDRSEDRKVRTYRKEDGVFGSVSSLEGSLSPASWDDLRAEELSFYKGNLPVCVSYHVEPITDEGVVLIMAPLDEGNLEITISVTVPK